MYVTNFHFFPLLVIVASLHLFFRQYFIQQKRVTHMHTYTAHAAMDFLYFYGEGHAGHSLFYAVQGRSVLLLNFVILVSPMA